MEYSNIYLLGFGLLGMFFYMLLKVKKINNKTVGKFNLGQFVRLEWPTMLLSICTIVICILAKNEVRQLNAVSRYLGLGFVFIGYGGQSVLYALFSKTDEKLKKGIDPTLKKKDD